MKVLLISRSDDHACVDEMQFALKRRGARGYRLDSDHYPLSVGLSTELSRAKTRRVLHVPDGAVELEALHAIWYRRFAAGRSLPASLGDTREACVDESWRTLYGAIAATACRQVDSLSAVRGCDHKELQLRHAMELGLDVPRTLITNEPEAVRKFARAVKGPLVTKLQHSFAIEREGVEHVVFTNPVRDEDLESLSGLAYCPMTFQEALPKRLELRATVVGERVFTAAVDSQALEGAKVDWRKEGVALLDAWEKHTLPRAVEKKLVRLVKRFGLHYAAADFIVTPDGRTVFLELNAGGEFHWLQRKPGLPIIEALADLLTSLPLPANAGRGPG